MATPQTPQPGSVRGRPAMTGVAWGAASAVRNLETDIQAVASEVKEKKEDSISAGGPERAADDVLGGVGDAAAVQAAALRDVEGAVPASEAKEDAEGSTFSGLHSSACEAQVSGRLAVLLPACT